MVVQYPHIATLKTPSAEAIQDAQGNWQPGADVEVNVSCRVEPAGGNGYITGAGGTHIDYSWVVYFPSGIEGIKTGTTITVTNAGEQILSDTVKRFSRGQLNCRAWL